MSVVEVLNVKLQRTEPSVSWGFNVQGGKDFHCPIMIQKVSVAGLAEKCSIRPNDFILRIGALSTEHLTHNQCRDSIVRQGNNLELTLQRGAMPRPDDYQAKLDFPQHQLMNPENVQQQPSLSPQVGVQLSKNKALLTQSYNSPMGLYSSQNIADSLVTSMKGMNVSDPNTIQAAQHISPKPQQKPSHHQQFNNPGVYRPPHTQAASSYYPMPHNNQTHFSVPELTPARPQQPQHLQQQQPITTNSPQPNKQAAKGRIMNMGSHIMNQPNPNSMPTCNTCHAGIRGPFVSAVGKVFCPNHFVCQHASCGLNLETCGFVEEAGKLYCEKDFQQYFAPSCFKCKSPIMGECSYALEKSFHPECFVCSHCRGKLGSSTFHMEDGLPYCPKDFAALFAQKCAGCEFPIEAGDQFFEAINQLWHCECFTCQTCHVQLKSSGFCVKGVKPYCKKHAF